MEFDISSVEKSLNDTRNSLTLPAKPSLQLAEFLGILAGDGYVAPYDKGNDYRISVFLNLTDEFPYLFYVKNLFFSLFNLEPIVILRSDINTATLKKDSKGITNFLYQTGYSKKNCIVTVPSWVWHTAEFTIPFVRGLFDTDGCISLKRNHGKNMYYPVAKIDSKDYCLIDKLGQWILNYKIPHSIFSSVSFDKRNSKTYSKKIIQISGYRNVEKLMDLLQPSNLKHRERWQLAISTKKVGRG
mgnify:CR=1 FL=1